MKKTIFLILVAIALYYGYEYIKFAKYQKCMIAINSIQEIAINDCLTKLNKE